MNARALAVSAGFLALAAAARADVLKVPQQFDTIQDAVTNANSGDAIVVSAGRYVGNVSISFKNDLELRANGNVVIEGVLALVPDAVLTLSNCTRVRVKGFRIERNEPEKCVLLSGCIECSIERCTIGPGGQGIGIGDAVGVLVDRCRIKNCLGSEVLVSSGACAITRNRIDRCGIDGIRVDAAVDRATVTDNVVTRAGNVGIFFVTSTIRGEIIDNGVSGGGIQGLRVFGDSIAVVGNRITGVDDPAIGMFAADTFAFGNVGTRCALGLEIHPCCTNGTHVENRFVRSETVGVQIDTGTTGNVLSGNRASKSGDFDFVDETGEGNTLIDNHSKTIGP